MEVTPGTEEIMNSIDTVPTEPKEDELIIPLLSEATIKPTFPYMRRLIQVSSVISMWPKSKNSSWFLYHLKFLLVLLICGTLIISFCIKVIREFKSIDSISALMDLLTVLISGFFRYIYIYIRGEKYLELVSMIHTKFIHFPLLSSTQRMSLERYYKLANKLILAYGTFTFGWLIQFVTLPIVTYVPAVSNLPSNTNITIPYPVPFDVYIPFDIQKQPTYALYYTYQIIGCMLFGLIYVVVDSFWYMVILLTIGQFVLIKDSVNTITAILKKEEELQEVSLLKENEIRKVEEGLKRCITHHQFLRTFVRTLDDISNPNILVDSLHAVISIGFILLDVTIHLNARNWVSLMFSLQYFITSITHMFFFDWLGNELSKQEEDLADAVYDIPWYRFPSQKTIFLLMILQSIRSCRLTGGKMYKLSLEFFATTVKATFSYFTFLLQMRNGRIQKK